VLPSPHCLDTLSLGFGGEPVGTKSWVAVCKGRFEKQVYAGGRSEQGPVGEGRCIREADSRQVRGK
jgi:hypothetical protein